MASTLNEPFWVPQKKCGLKSKGERKIETMLGGKKMAIQFFDPTGSQEQTQQVTMAPRFKQLQGLRIDILDNGKQNSAQTALEGGQITAAARGCDSWENEQEVDA